jgi:hypothetical protein
MAQLAGATMECLGQQVTRACFGLYWHDLPYFACQPLIANSTELDN